MKWNDNVPRRRIVGETETLVVSVGILIRGLEVLLRHDGCRVMERGRLSERGWVEMRKGWTGQYALLVTAPLTVLSDGSDSVFE